MISKLIRLPVALSISPIINEDDKYYDIPTSKKYRFQKDDDEMDGWERVKRVFKTE